VLKRFVIFSVIGVACLLVQDALAVLDLNPPVWRGEPGSTYQIWDFDTDTNPVAPDSYVNPYGAATVTIIYEDDFSTSWIEEDAATGHYGIWKVEDWIKLQFPNDPAAPPQQKTIWIQMMFRVPPEYEHSESQIFTNSAYASVETLEEILGDDQYMRATYMITLDTSPALEEIYILPRDHQLYVDWLIVDTIPEPATMGLLLIGLLMTLRGRRR
jgi:hypothetical protein